MIYKLIWKRIFAVYFIFVIGLPPPIEVFLFWENLSFREGGQRGRLVNFGLLRKQLVYWQPLFEKTMIIWLFEQIFLRRKRIYKFHYRFKDSNCQKFRILIFYFKKLPFEIYLKLSFFSIENHFWYFSKKSKRTRTRVTVKRLYIEKCSRRKRADDDNYRIYSHDKAGLK